MGSGEIFIQFMYPVIGRGFQFYFIRAMESVITNDSYLCPFFLRVQFCSWKMVESIEKSNPSYYAIDINMTLFFGQVYIKLTSFHLLAFSYFLLYSSLLNFNDYFLKIQTHILKFVILTSYS